MIYFVNLSVNICTIRTDQSELKFDYSSAYMYNVQDIVQNNSK